MPDDIILVDKNDNQIGTGRKMPVHEQAQLHRAFSIFIFNDKGQLLLQQRAAEKYHCGGLWTNTVCSHPRPGETILETAHRRLKEEMGFDCDLREVGSFIYQAKFENDLTEHEFDHIVVGTYSGYPVLNREEAADFRWQALAEVEQDIARHPKRYTPWFKIIFEKYLDKIN